MKFFNTLLGAGLIAIASHSAGADLANSSWSLTRVDNIYPDGTRVALYGDQPQGTIMFDGTGHYTLQIYRRQRSAFAVPDKSKGTPDEYRAAAMEANAHIGRYAVDDGAITFHIEQATFPNWIGSARRSPFTLKGDILLYTVAAPTSGQGATGEVEWKRMR